MTTTDLYVIFCTSQVSSNGVVAEEGGIVV